MDAMSILHTKLTRFDGALHHVLQDGNTTKSEGVSKEDFYSTPVSLIPQLSRQQSCCLNCLAGHGAVGSIM